MKWDQKRVAELRKKLAKGARYADVAEEWGVSYQAVQQAAFRFGIPCHHTAGKRLGYRLDKPTSPDAKKIVEARRSGLTFEDIIKKHNVSLSNAHRIYHRWKDTI